MKIVKIFRNMPLRSTSSDDITRSAIAIFKQRAEKNILLRIAYIKEKAEYALRSNHQAKKRRQKHDIQILRV